jgi:exopolyphosphatase / guanosine-5'-triphosphate,3'-diphosphate pyrophosphatase
MRPQRIVPTRDERRQGGGSARARMATASGHEAPHCTTRLYHPAPRRPESMRIAAIDIGTNSVHMIIVQVRPDRSFEVIDREKVMTRLGAGGLDGRALTPSAMAATLQALSKFQRLAASRQVDDIVAAATSATREAENAGDFLATIATHTGIRAQVITGPEEARLIHLAASYGTTFSGGTVVIDIGGGSVEITYGTGDEPDQARSFKIGVIRLTERFVRSDPLDARDLRRLVRYVEREAGDYLDGIVASGFQQVIGTSGTLTSLGTLALTHQGASVADVRNLRVPVKALHRLRKHIVTLDLQERLGVPGLDPKRADLAPAGVVLIDTLLRRLGATDVVLSDFALREGLVLDYIRRNRRQIATVDQYPDVRRRSVMELGDRLRYWTPHARHVALLATRLFDETREMHGLGDREREWLEFGALLHDIGMHISYKAHHRHSYYLIRNGGLRGMEPDEIEVIAQVARYHRRGRPRKSHDAYARLRPRARRAVRVLSACVRLAESLDRSHGQVIADLHLVRREHDCVLRLQTTGDAELETWAAHRQVAPFERVLGCTVRVETLPAVGVPPSAEPAPPARRDRPTLRNKVEIRRR